MLDHLRELDLQTAGHDEAVLGLHDVGHAALPRLAVDADDGLVAAPDMGRVDGQVRHAPLRIVRRVRQCGEALLDGVLVRAGERRVHEVADVRMPRVHRQPVAVLGDAAQVVDVRDVELRIDALREQVHGDVDDVEVARPLAIAEQGAFDAIGTGHQAELGCGDTAAAVVVRVQADLHAVTMRDATVERLDQVGIDVRRRHLDRGRQVQDQRPRRPRVDDVDHGFADLDGVVDLGAGEALGRVLVADRLALGHLRLLVQAIRRGVGGDLGDAGPVEPEHDPALQRRSRVVEVHDRLLHADQRLIGAVDEVVTALHQHLDRNVFGNQVLLDQQAAEVEVGLARAREADLDLLEAHVDECLEHFQLAARVHRVDERLVAVTEVDRAPHRGPRDAGFWPRAVGKADDRVGAVLVERHRLWGAGLGRHGVLRCVGWVGCEIECGRRTSCTETYADKQKTPGLEGTGVCGEHRM